MTPTDRAIESALRSLAGDVSYPETPAIASRAAQELRRSQGESGRASRSRPRWQIVVAGAAAVASVVVATMAISPTARRAVAGWLGVDGVRITFDERAEDTPVGDDDLYLGTRVSARRAEAATSFDVTVPQALGEPDAYYLMRYIKGGEVSLVWRPGPGLPESAHTGVGAILTEFIGETAPETLKKGAGSGTSITSVAVNGRPGLFIEGTPHLIVRAPSGDERVLSPRLAGNTLLWDAGDVTYRLEADIDLDRALEIAASLRD